MIEETLPTNCWYKRDYEIKAQDKYTKNQPNSKCKYYKKQINDIGFKKK